jgi:hypothetical protein
MNASASSLVLAGTQTDEVTLFAFSYEDTEDFHFLRGFLRTV